MESERFQIHSAWAEQNKRDPSEEPEFPGRRSFFAALIGVGTALVGALLSVPLIRFTLYPLLTKTTKTKWSKIGPTSDFNSLTDPIRRTVEIEHVDGWRKTVLQKTVYITKGTGRWSENGIEALSSICPHLGCEVPWNKSRGQFVCPCHNSVFAADGSYVSGPSPRGMDTLPIKTENGDLMVRFEFFRQLVPDKEEMG